MKKNIKVIRDPITNMIWVVRIVRKGDTYGLNDCLTHDEPVPLVEFYDARFGHTDLGQFVSRYNAPILCNHKGYLTLCGGAVALTVYAAAMREVVEWLKLNL